MTCLHYFQSSLHPHWGLRILATAAFTGGRLFCLLTTVIQGGKFKSQALKLGRAILKVTMKHYCIIYIKDFKQFSKMT